MNHMNISKFNGNRSELLYTYLRKNSRRKLTIEQICDGVNGMLKTTKPRIKFTPQQVGPYLTRLTSSKMLVKFNGDGINSNGRTVSRWKYNYTA